MVQTTPMFQLQRLEMISVDELKEAERLGPNLSRLYLRLDGNLYTVHEPPLHCFCSPKRLINNIHRSRRADPIRVSPWVSSPHAQLCRHNTRQSKGNRVRWRLHVQRVQMNHGGFINLQAKLERIAPKGRKIEASVDVTAVKFGIENQTTLKQ